MATSAEAPPGDGLAHALGVVVLAPTGRDASLLVTALATAGIPAESVLSPDALLERVVDEVARDDAPRLGAVVATDDALAVDWSAKLAAALDEQPSWSDLPLVLLAGSTGVAPAAVAERLTARGSVTVLDRPIRVAALVSAVRAALRARARQVEVRELIADRDHAVAAAEHASRTKSDFLAMMSHELRTPLNAISGYVELLLMGLRGPITDEQRDYLERIRRSQLHLLGVINDILNFTRIESGRLEFDMAPLPLVEVIADVAPMVEPLLAAKGLTLETCVPDPEVHVEADREKLRQVLLNLVANAVKFTAPGGTITLEVSSPTNGAEPANGAGVVRLGVSDTGIGIPADKIESIFEPFVQVRLDRATVREGTGLGLAISRDLMRGMQGDLSARSEVGRGSTFTVELRRAPATR